MDTYVNLPPVNIDERSKIPAEHARPPTGYALFYTATYFRKFQYGERENTQAYYKHAVEVK